jgi:integrase
VNGRPVGGDWYGTRLFHRAVDAAGLLPGTTGHDLRHAYASRLLAEGEWVVAVERLGHDDASLVLKTYGHLMPDSEDRTRRAMDETWCAQNVPHRASDVR